MSNITRVDPVNEIARLDPFLNVDDMFNRFMMRPILRGAAGPQIKMDVKETDGQYLIHADIPGVNKDDIHVTVEGNRVSISAEVKQEKETKEGERVISRERSYGMASRSFSLGAELDQENVKASYNNGVLELTLPKKPGTAVREISIS
ncbi:MAG: Hsp20/alpha crystallin family protein [Gallionella sp.]|nr:Hsp20/alpha crystallin family protein [Gallionella sp.]